jgi:hypothetical protein
MNLIGLQVHNIELQNRAKTAELVIWMKHSKCLGPTRTSVKKRWCWNPMRSMCRMQSIGILKMAMNSIQKASLRKNILWIGFLHPTRFAYKQ